MEEKRFLVKGSSDEPYQVIFRIEGKNLTALCSCPAGINGLHCKHRLRILQGISDNIVSENVKDVKIVQNWLIGTDVENVIEELNIAEIELEKQKNNVSYLKKKLAKALLD